MTVDDFLRSVIVALENQAIEEQTKRTDETHKKEEQTEETPKKEETSERKKLSNAEFLTATLRFGIGEDDAELLGKLIRDATPSWRNFKVVLIISLAQMNRTRTMTTTQLKKKS